MVACKLGVGVMAAGLPVDAHAPQSIQCNPMSIHSESHGSQQIGCGVMAAGLPAAFTCTPENKIVP
eukprot:1141384-Pelagomonas_calceolata.AAC.1